MFSGGLGSWAAAKRVAATHGTSGLVLLFTDTGAEDVDLYRFLDEAAADVGVPVTRVADGRTPFEVFRDERFLGNSRTAPCTRALKQRVALKWLQENCNPAETVLYVGIDWTEEHRFVGVGDRPGIKAAWAKRGWVCEAPLCEPPLLAKWQVQDMLRLSGIALPLMYRQGFSHNNCGGECVRAGIGHWTKLYHMRPLNFMHAEGEEQAMREMLGRDVSILSETRDGEEFTLTLRNLRRRIEDGAQIDMFAIGGCGCFTEPDEDAA